MRWEELLNKERRRPSTSPGDHRTEFERDWDRSIFSTPVKRLQDKTQVFPLDPHDAVRTRLTHSLEVSSVARGLGMAIGQWLLDAGRIQQGMERCIEAITATCGLIHDLGNPPFGHAGEDAIRSWFQRCLGEPKLRELVGGQEQWVQDFLQFEGNAQTLRLVTKLQILADFSGLNLTYGTLSTACKYLAPSDKVDKNRHAFSKPGFFASDREVIDDIRAKTGTGEARHPLAYIVEAADDIVYSVADIEDGVKKGVITWPEVQAALTANQIPSIAQAIERGERILKAGNPTVLDGVRADARVAAFRTGAIAVAVLAVIETFKAKYGEIMAGTYEGELVKDCTAADLVANLKSLGSLRVYNTPPTLKLELLGRRIIFDLMDIFWEGAQFLPAKDSFKTKTFQGKAAALLSDNYRQVFQHVVTTQSTLPEMYHRLILVTDYVSGMTDSFAKRLHVELTNG